MHILVGEYRMITDLHVLTNMNVPGASRCAPIEILLLVATLAPSYGSFFGYLDCMKVFMFGVVSKGRPRRIPYFRPPALTQYGSLSSCQQNNLICFTESPP